MTVAVSSLNMKNRLHVFAALVLVAMLVLAGCANTGSDGGDSAGSPDVDFSQGAPTESNVGDDGTLSYQGQIVEYPGTSEQSMAVPQRSLILTGEIHLEVNDFTTARKQIVSAVQDRDGFISASNTNLHRDGNKTWQTGYVELRIPNENFPSLQTEIEEVGTVVSSNTETQDVTDQLVDLEARLKNLKSQREKLRELYTDANETNDVLEVQERLSEVQSAIERLEARQKSLQDRVAYSTITVQLRESPPDDVNVLEQQKWYQKGVLPAFLASVDGVAVVLRALVVGTAYALPYLAVFAVPLGAIVLLVKRRS